MRLSNLPREVIDKLVVLAAEVPVDITGPDVVNSHFIKQHKLQTI